MNIRIGRGTDMRKTNSLKVIMKAKLEAEKAKRIALEETPKNPTPQQ